MSSPPKLSRFLLWILGALLVTRLAVALLGVGRGLELGDEGFLLLNLNRPEAAPPLFGFYAFLAPFDLPPFTVVGVRLLRIAVELLASLALVAGVFCWGRERGLLARGTSFMAFLVVCGVGAFLSTASRAFGYNDMTNLCVFAATGGLFLLDTLPAEPPGRRLARWLGFGIGLLLGLQLLVKFPAAVSMLLAFAGLLATDPLRPARERAARLASIALGTLVMPLLWVATIGGPSALGGRLAEAGVVNRLTGYGVGEILWRYLVLDLDAYAQLVGLALLVVAAFRLARRLLSGRPDARDLAFSGALLLGALALSWSARRLHPFWVHPSLIHLFCTALFATGALAVLSRRAHGTRQLVWMGSLVLLPFLLIAGTNVPLSVRLPTHILPLVVALSLLGFALAGRGLRRSAEAALVVVALSSVWVFVQHQILAPYGLPAPLHRQTEPLAGLPGVRVDADSRVFLEGVRTRLHAAGFEPGDPVIAFDYMPGLVSYLGARSPGFPFYVFDNPPLNCFNANRSAGASGSGKPPRPWLILGRPMSERQRACIDAFDFPSDFRLVAQLPNPYAGVYARSFGGPGMEQVSLYAPLP